MAEGARVSVQQRIPVIPAAAGSVLVSLTEFRPHAWRDLPHMAWIALWLRAGWYGLPGAVGLYLWTDLPRRCAGLAVGVDRSGRPTNGGPDCRATSRSCAATGRAARRAPPNGPARRSTERRSSPRPSSVSPRENCPRQVADGRAGTEISERHCAAGHHRELLAAIGTTSRAGSAARLSSLSMFFASAGSRTPNTARVYGLATARSTRHCLLAPAAGARRLA